MDAIDIATTPIGFIETVLGLSMYDWQQDAVFKLELAGWGKPIVQISCLAPNEGGKSSRVVAGAALYWLSVHARGKVRIQTNDQKQLELQVIPALEQQVYKFEGYTSKRSPFYQIATKTGGLLAAFVTDQASRVEGMHGSPEEPFLDIIDEAKSVLEPIFDASDRCGFQARMFTSSGGLEAGTFWKSHTVNRAQFHCVRAGLLDCPHISQAKIDRIIEKHGENAPFTRSCLYGEFMKQDDEDSYIFPHAAVLFAIENPPTHRSGQRIGFVDFAEGSAEHVLAVRDGNKTTIPLAFREANKHAACSRLIRGFLTAGLKQDQIWGDAADKDSLEILASLGWRINRKNFGAPALRSEEYISWSAEAWHETALAVSKGELIIPDDPVLIAQLTCRKKTITGRGKQGAEEKYDMRKRGIESPDRADAWCGANNVFDYNQPAKQAWSIPTDWMEQLENEGQRKELVSMGAQW